MNLRCLFMILVCLGLMGPVSAQIIIPGGGSGGGAATLIIKEIDGTPTGTFNTLKVSNGALTDNGDGSATLITGAGGGGDTSSNTATSVDNEIVLFSGTAGKTIKRATTTGVLKATSGVIGAATAGTDYVVPGGNVATATALAANGTNCNAGEAALGVSATGVAEGCYDVTTQAEFDARALTINGTTNEVSVTGGSQTLAANRTWTVALDSILNLSSKTLRVPNGTALPGTCTTGDAFMDTDATSGQRWYLCQSTNTWVVQGDGGAGGASGFANITSGTNTSAAMVIGAGSTLGYTSTGTNDASHLGGTAASAYPTLTSASILTNKQNVPRTVTQTVTANAITPNADTTDYAIVPALSADLTINTPSPAVNVVNGQELTFRFKDTASRTLTWGAGYTGENGIALPTATSGVNYDWAKFIYNSTTSKWGLVATTLAVTRGVTTLASSTTFTCPGDTSSRCEMQMTGSAGTITVANITGTPVNGDLIWLAFQCTNAQTLSWNAAFMDGAYQTRPTSCAANTDAWLEVLVRYSTVESKWVVLVGASAGTATFTQTKNLPITGVKLPSSNPATIDVSENNNRLLFDAATSECVIWPFVWPSDWTSGATLKVQYSMTSATSGGVSIDVAVVAVTPGDAVDINTKPYDTVNNCDDAAVPTTAGYLDQISCTLTNKDSVAAGDYARIKLCRAVADAADTATGDMEVVGVELSYTH